MKKIILLFVVLLMIGAGVYAQVAINTDGSLPDTSAMLDVKSTEVYWCSGVLVKALQEQSKLSRTNNK